jgi:MHS family proline/betaine transporter-like MFS transporter
MAAAIGNAFEWYDFSVYLFFASTISRKFFPVHNEATAFLATLAIFGLGLLARPVGAFVIGRMADRQGRKPALLFSIYLMAAGTLVIAVVPPFAAIGVGGPFLLVMGRIVQGLSVGGVWGCTGALIIEWSPNGRRGVMGGLQQSGVVLGVAIASAVAAMLGSMLTPVEVSDWGWRLPFLLGGLIGPLGVYLSAVIEEPPAAKAAAGPPADLRVAARTFAMSLAWAAGFYILVNHMPAWTQRYLRLDATAALWTNCLLLVVVAALAPAMGRLSDIWGRRKVLLGACAVYVLLPYPAFEYLESGSVAIPALIAIEGIFVLALAAYCGAGLATLAEMVPPRRRANWMGTAYALAVAIVGGLAAYIGSGAVISPGAATANSLLLSATALVSAAAIWTMRETAFDDLQPQSFLRSTIS